MVGAIGLTLLNADYSYHYFGASAAVAAAIGAYIAIYPKTQFRFTSANPIMPSFLFLVPGWFLAQVFLAVHWHLLWSVSYAGIWPQVFSFGLGFGTARLMQRSGYEQRLMPDDFRAIPEPAVLRGRIERVREEGDRRYLLKLLARAYRHYPDQPDFRDGYWEQAVAMERGKEALAAGKAMWAEHVAAGRYEQAFFLWLQLDRVAPDRPMPPNLIMDLVNGLLFLGLRDEAVRLVDRTLAAYSDDPRLENLLRLALGEELAPPERLSATTRGILAQRRLEPDLRTRFTELAADIEEMAVLSPSEEDREAARAIELAPEESPGADEEDPFTPTRITLLRRLHGAPGDWLEQGLAISIDEQPGRHMLAFERIRGIAGAAIRPISEQPYLVLDLLTDDPAREQSQHTLWRTSSRRFDPLIYAPDQTSPAKAVRVLIERLLQASGGMALPDREQLLHKRFPTFTTERDFEREIYGV
jgi:tetratricopeptide (TPR) repeat protein